jgi:hypothetical protein
MVLLVSVATAIIRPVYATANATQDVELSLGQVVQKLLELEPYVTYTEVNGIKQQVLNSTEASKDGFPDDVLLLAEEMILYQNDYLKYAAENDDADISKSPTSMDRYPRLERFFEFASEHQKNGVGEETVLKSVNPCGDWNNPIPNFTPSWISFTHSNPRTMLANLGFHNTAGYACSGGLWPCQDDFTRGRSYTSSHGTCASPRFRDHGRVTGATSFRIQYGECNPEVHSYSWPYWNWPAYCRWWHQTY